MKEKILKDIKEALMRGDRETVTKLTKAALDAGVGIPDILNDGLIAGMEIIGGKFKNNEVFIPEVLIAAKAMHAGMALIEPHFLKCGIKPVGKVVIGTVKGDLHDIGKNLVAAMLEGGGYEVIDLGVNVSPEQFISAVRDKGANIVAMSALLTTTMPAMKATVDALKQAGVRGQVKILVGGAPITQKYADEIGADGYSESAAGVVGIAKRALN